MSRVDTLIAKNRRALHDYEILETYEAGIVLTGTEVCSLRENNRQLMDCFALASQWGSGGCIIFISHFIPAANIANLTLIACASLPIAIRSKIQQRQEKGMVLVLPKIYFDKNSRKIELAVARAQPYDKRAAMAERDSKRETDRAPKAQSFRQGKDAKAGMKRSRLHRAPLHAD